MSGLVSARICPSVCLLGKIPLVFRVTMLMFLPVGISGGQSAGVGGSVCMVVSLCPLSAAVGGVGVSSVFSVGSVAFAVCPIGSGWCGGPLWVGCWCG